MYLKINLVANNINQDKRKTLQFYILLKNLKIGVQEWLDPGSSRVSIGLDSLFLRYNSDKLFFEDTQKKTWGPIEENGDV